LPRDEISLITLIPATVDYAEELLQFELDNRAFFETRINARLSSFYSLQGVTKALELAEQDALADVGYQYLIVADSQVIASMEHDSPENKSQNIVGRINLSRVRRAHFHSAELGYRIAQAACGQGFASKAIGLVMAKAFTELQLVRLEATASEINHASIRALQRNGFSQFGRARRSFELQGCWYDLLHFEAHANYDFLHQI